MFIFGVNVVAIPIDNVVLVSLGKLMKCVHLILNNSLTGTYIQIVRPRLSQILHGDVGSVEESMVHLKRPSIHIVARKSAEYEESQERVYARDKNSTLAQFDMPKLIGK